MKRFALGLGVFVAGLALTAAPALAQKPNDSSPPPSASSRGGGGVASGGGGGGAAAPAAGVAMPASSSGGSSSGTTSMGSSPSAAPAMAPSMRAASAASREAAPVHRVGGGYPSGPAVSRTAVAPQRTGAIGIARTDGAAPRGTASGARTNPGESSAVPSWARPRNGAPVTDTAVPRTSATPRPGNGNNPNVYVNPGYAYCGGLFGCGYNGYYNYGGYGYDYYDPFYGSIYSPFYGYGMGLGLDGYPMFDTGGGEAYNYGVGSYSTQYGSPDDGNLKLKVKPRQAKVYVDGYFVGIVDQFDGAFQKLPLAAGRHHVKIDADGYQPDEFDATITPGQTVTFEGTLKKVQ